jgi:1,4-alpha-glucan branching enzyme
VNFSGEPHYDYRVGLPRTGTWREVVNTDVTDYGGSGIGNYGRVTAVADPWHGRPASAVLTLPPLATLWLVHDESAQLASAGQGERGVPATEPAPDAHLVDEVRLLEASPIKE